MSIHVPSYRIVNSSLKGTVDYAQDGDVTPISLGGDAAIYKTIDNQILQFRGLTAGTGVVVSETENSVKIELGSASQVSVGDGAAVPKDILANTARYRGLSTADPTITLTENATNITIERSTNLSTTLSESNTLGSYNLIINSGNEIQGQTDLIVTIPGTLIIYGDLYVNGNAINSVSVQADSAGLVSITDRYLALNVDHNVNVANSGGLVGSYHPTATTDAVAGAFTAGVDATSNPTVVTSGSGTFSSGDLVLITNNDTNNGFYEVSSHVGTTLTIKGVGTVPTTDGWLHNQFIADTTNTGTITKVSVGVLQFDTSGEFGLGIGSSTPLVYKTYNELTVGTGLSEISGSISLVNTAVSPGSYISSTLTVNQQGFVTSAASGSGADFAVFTLNNDYTPIAEWGPGTTNWTQTGSIPGMVATDTELTFNTPGTYEIRAKYFSRRETSFSEANASKVAYALKNGSTAERFLQNVEGPVHVYLSATTMHGSQSLSGLFVNQGIESTGYPSSRRRFCRAYSTDENYIYIYGGEGYTSSGSGPTSVLSDLWRYNISTNKWTWLDGAGNISGEAVNYGSLGVESASVTPGGRGWSSMFVDSNGFVYLFGGSTAFTTNGNRSDIFRWNPGTGQWAWIGGPNTANAAGVYGTTGVEDAANEPPAFEGGRDLYDPENNYFYIVAPRNNTSSYGGLDDIWRYNISNGYWTHMKGSKDKTALPVFGVTGVEDDANTPGCMTETGGWCISFDRQYLYIFGGYQRTGGLGVTGALWRLNFSNYRWAYMGGTQSVNQIRVTGTVGEFGPTVRPGCRYDSAMLIDENNWVYIWAGTGVDTTTTIDDDLADVWVFNGTEFCCLDSRLNTTTISLGTSVGHELATPGWSYSSSSQPTIPRPYFNGNTKSTMTFALIGNNGTNVNHFVKFKSQKNAYDPMEVRNTLKLSASDYLRFWAMPKLLANPQCRIEVTAWQ